MLQSSTPRADVVLHLGHCVLFKRKIFRSPHGWLLALVLLASYPGTARADTFDITFNPIATVTGDGYPFRHQFVSGTIITDGTCTICSISQGLSTIRDGIDIVEINGTGPFALGDPNFLNYGRLTLDLTTDTLTGSILDIVSDPLNFGYNGPGTYFFDGGGTVYEQGRFSISDPQSVPEPSSYLLLITVMLLVNMRSSVAPPHRW